MLELEQAVEKILAAIPAPKSEVIPLADACGQIIAEKILAATDLPPFDNSAVDGYAVHSQDVAAANVEKPVTLQLTGRIAAGEHFTGQLSAGQCIRIFTGSPVPAGADAVVMQEDTRIATAVSSPSPPRSGGEVVLRAQGEVLILDAVKPWENIRFHGEDVKRGAVIIQPGERLGAAHISLLAATGTAQVNVNRRPTVALLATGSELREPASGAPSTSSASSPTASPQLLPGQIFESNRAALTPLIAATGAIPKIFPIVPDTAEATRAALARAFAECDIVITCGGVSVGEMDFVKSAFEELGGRLDFWKVAIKPGRPFVFGRLGKSPSKGATPATSPNAGTTSPSPPGSGGEAALTAQGDPSLDVRCSMLDVGCSQGQGEKLLFGLPGNPISAFVTFLLLARPALLRWQGASNVTLPHSMGILAEPISNPDGRRHFIRVTLNAEGKVHSAGTQASHILSSLALANGLIDVPPKTTLAPETLVRVLRWE
jgi:molybdopterin molybdotransferase